MEQGERSSHQAHEPLMRDMLHTILGEVWETRATIEKMEGRRTSMEGNMMSMEKELASWRPFKPNA